MVVMHNKRCITLWHQGELKVTQGLYFNLANIQFQSRFCKTNKKKRGIFFFSSFIITPLHHKMDQNF